LKENFLPVDPALPVGPTERGDGVALGLGKGIEPGGGDGGFFF